MVYFTLLLLLYLLYITNNTVVKQKIQTKFKTVIKKKNYDTMKLLLFSIKYLPVSSYPISYNNIRLKNKKIGCYLYK